jgi:hypothetical protein
MGQGADRTTFLLLRPSLAASQLSKPIENSNNPEKNANVSNVPAEARRPQDYGGL